MLNDSIKNNNPTHAAGAQPRDRYPAGQRLHCHNCGSEIEIISPCPCNPPDMVLQCCGQDMRASVGQDQHVGVE